MKLGRSTVSDQTSTSVTITTNNGTKLSVRVSPVATLNHFTFLHAITPCSVSLGFWGFGVLGFWG
ncbi:MAG: hypothetical protein P4M11_06800, partial [Candidatus Pacebacteria bacterium]|nr:hypothetical protein [Candidatus Paceibacterota bacterium]